MFCSNCKREILGESAKFCPDCGSPLDEKVNNIEDEVLNLDDDLKFEETQILDISVATATKVEEEINKEEILSDKGIDEATGNDELKSSNVAQNNISVGGIQYKTTETETNSRQAKATDPIKDKNKKSYKGLIISLVVVLVLAVVGAGVLIYLKGKIISEDKIKEIIIGEKVDIEGYEEKLTSKKITEFKINDRDSAWRDYDNIEAELVLNLDEIKMSLDTTIKLRFKNGEWVVKSIDVDEIADINLSDDSIKNVENDLKKCYFEYGDYDYIDLDSDIVKKISNINIEDKEGFAAVLTAEVLLSNGILEAKYKVEGEVEYSLYSKNWQFTSSSLESTVIEAEKIIEGGDSEGIVNIIKDTFEYGEYIEYKPEGSDKSEEIRIDGKAIQELKVNSFVNDDKGIKVDLEMKASSGVLKEAVITGVLYLNKSLLYPEIVESKLAITTLNYDEISLDTIKEALKEYTFKDKQITDEELNTFVITKSANGEYLDERYVNGTITIAGTQQKLLIKAYLSYNYDNDIYEWDIYTIYDEGNSGYKEL